MARHTHPDDDRVYACPECDAAGGIYRRTHQNKDFDDPLRCHKCGHTFDDDAVVDRKSKTPADSGGMIRDDDGIPASTKKETADMIRRIRDR